MRFPSSLAVPLLWVISAAAAASGATISVDSADDVVADDGFCTLREAVIAANTDTASGATAGECVAGSGADLILVPAGTYVFAIAGRQEDAAATGDLDLLADVEIEGAGAADTVVDGADLDRVFHVHPGVMAELLDVTIQNGHASTLEPAVRGGGLQNLGTLALRRCVLTRNLASGDPLLGPNGSGGAIHNAMGASLVVEDSTLSFNSAQNTGGGILNEGTLVVERSTLADNRVTRVQSIGGGGIAHFAGSATLSNSTLSGNLALGTLGGGAIRLATGVSISLLHCTLSGNDTSFFVVGGDGIDGGSATLANTILDDDCSAVSVSSIGGNVETVASTCGLTDLSDQVNVPVADLALAPLADNGGPTQTHAIGAASVARDAALEANCTETDERGVLRPDGDGAPGPACDSGAFELPCALDPDLCVAPPTTTTSTTTSTSTTTTLPGGGVPCPPGVKKVNVRFHYRANGSSGSWSAKKSTSCTNGSIVIGPQAMGGDMKLSPGATLEAGYSFTLPGNNQSFTANVSNASVVFQLNCVSGAAASPSTLTVPMAPAAYPVTGSEWVPTGDQQSPLVYQGSNSVPDACSGGKVRFNLGGTFSATILLN